MLINVSHITPDQTAFVEAKSVGLKNGAYLPFLRVKKLPDLSGKKFVVLYAAPEPRQYALISEASRSDYMGFINGGVAADPDYEEVGTFGVYSVNAKAPRLEFWADFDHWPLDEKSSEPGRPKLKDGLADGHIHDTPHTGKAIPMTTEVYALYRATVQVARMG